MTDELRVILEIGRKRRIVAGSMDWPGVADAMGVRGFRAASAGELRAHLDDALALDGPSLIEAQIDPAGYGRMLGTLRG